MSFNYPRAVCFLLINQEGDILCVSRVQRDAEGRKVLTEDGDVIPIDAWGLPGGKIDPGESGEIAVVRETFEETGLVISDPVPVLTRLCPGEVTYMCTTYTATVVGTSNPSLKRLRGEGALAWKSPMQLMGGPFAEYNLAVFKAVGRLGPDVQFSAKQTLADDLEGTIADSVKNEVLK